MLATAAVTSLRRARRAEMVVVTSSPSTTKMGVSGSWELVVGEEITTGAVMMID